MDLHELFKTIESDTGVSGLDPSNLRDTRRHYLARALGDHTFSVRDSAHLLRGYEFFSKCANLPGVTPDKAWPKYLTIQTSADKVTAPDAILNSVSTALRWLWKEFDAGAAAMLCRHGPGAVLEGNTSYDKWLFDLPLDHALTAYCDPLYRFPRSLSVSNCNSFIEIPKTSWSNRGIAVEGQSAQFLQQGIGRLMRRRLQYSGIDISRSWATNISLLKDPSYGTIDLSGASDSITCTMMKLIAPDGALADWLAAMDASRSEWVISPAPDRSLVRLKTYASMGNGFSFVLLSSVCIAAVMAAIHACMPQYRHDRRGTFAKFRELASVFGDDIVCHESIRDQLNFILLSLGFTINIEKSSTTGPMRESCGTFVFHEAPGRVRTVASIPRLRSYTPTGIPGLLDICTLQRSCARAYLYETAEFLAEFALKMGQGLVTAAPVDMAERGLGGSLVVLSDAYPNRTIWSRKTCQRALRAYVCLPITRRPQLGDCVGWGATLYSGLSEMTSPEKCGDKTHLCVRLIKG